MDSEVVSMELVRIAGLLSAGVAQEIGQEWVDTYGFDKVFEALESVDWNYLAAGTGPPGRPWIGAVGKSNRSLMKKLNKLEIAELEKTDAYEEAIVDGFDEDDALDIASDVGYDELAEIRYNFFRKNIRRMEFDPKLVKQMERYL